MRQVILGQVFLIVCCCFYLGFWYTGYKPGVNADRMNGINGVLFAATALTGMAGILLCLIPSDMLFKVKFPQMFVLFGGIVMYIILMLVTKYGFGRIVTTELFLIVGWTMLEVSILNKLAGTGVLDGAGLVISCLAVLIAFLVSMVLYVAYYRMEDMKAFYAAMVPLVTEAVAMLVLVLVLLGGLHGQSQRT